MLHLTIGALIGLHEASPESFAAPETPTLNFYGSPGPGARRALAELAVAVFGDLLHPKRRGLGATLGELVAAGPRAVVTFEFEDDDTAVELADGANAALPAFAAAEAAGKRRLMGNVLLLDAIEASAALAVAQEVNDAWSGGGPA